MQTRLLDREIIVVASGEVDLLSKNNTLSHTHMNPGVDLLKISAILLRNCDNLLRDLLQVLITFQFLL